MTATEDDLLEFLDLASRDAIARDSSFFGSPPLLAKVFADAEIAVIEKLKNLIQMDADTRRFVQGWATLVKTSHDYPRFRGAALPVKEGDMIRWFFGQPCLDGAAVTAWDAFVLDEAIKEYRTLGQLDED